MRRIIGVQIGTVASILFGLLCLFPMPAESNPVNIAIVPYSFGDHPAGGIARFNVSIANHWNQTVVIKDVQTSCGCTSAKPARWKISPHGKDQLAVRVDGLLVGGTFHGTVLVVGKMAATVPVAWRIDLTGTFVTAGNGFVPDPRMIHLGYPRPGEKMVQMVNLRRNGLPPIGPVTVTTTVPWITVTKDQQRSTNTNFEYKVVIRPPFIVGRFRQEILFQGNNAADMLRIPIFGHTLPVIGIFPDKVLLMPGQQVYPLEVIPPADSHATLKGYHLKESGIKILSVRQSKKLINGKPAIDIRTMSVGTGFISAKVFLRFKHWKKPVQVVFVGIGQ